MTSAEVTARWTVIDDTLKSEPALDDTSQYEQYMYTQSFQVSFCVHICVPTL